MDYVHAQSAPDSATSTTLYTNSTGAPVLCGGVTATNRSATPTTIRVSIDPAGAGDSDPDYYAYDLPIGGNQVITGLAAGEAIPDTGILRVYNTLANISFHATIATNL